MQRVMRASTFVASLALVAGALVVTGAGAASAAQPTTAAPAALAGPAKVLAASTIRGWSTTAVTMKVNGEVSSAVSVKPGGVRTGYVQARKGATGAVANRTALTTSSSGVVAARFVPTSTGTWYVRVAIRATATAAAAVTAWRKVTVSGTAAASTISTPAVVPGTVLKGTAQKLSAVVKPAGVRVVEFYGRAPGSSAYVLRGRTSSSSTGAAAFSWKAPTAGSWSYKAYVRPSLTLKGATSLLRSATVTARPAAVTNLAAVPTFDSIALSWTNPTQWLAKVVVRRTLSIDPVPATPTDGTSVALSSLTASSVTDAGLTDQTEYRYTVFTLDSLGRYLPGVWLTQYTTDKPPAQVTGVSADTGVSATSVTLSWTNPALDLDHVAVRRSLATDPAPTSVFEGTEVPLGTPTATTVTDTGLTPGTAYRYSIISVNSNGTPSQPVHVLATTMAAALTWSSAVAANPAHGSPQAIDCVGASFCVAVDTYGYVVEYNGSSWGAPTALPGASLNGRAVSCQGSACVVSTLDGRIFRRVSAGVWTLQAAKDSSAEFAISCAGSTTFCLAADVSGKVRYSTDGGSTWSARSSLPSPTVVYAADCVTATFCKLVGAAGRTWTFAGVVSGVPSLTLDAAVTTDQLASVDCVTTSFCVFLTATGKAWKTGDLTATSMDSPSNSPTDVSCGTVTSCMAVDYTGRTFEFNGSTWAAAVRPDSRAQLISVSCTGSAYCVALDTSSFGWELRWTGSTWTAVNPIDVYNGTTRVSCPTPTFCAAVDASGRAVTFDGTSWSAPTDISYPYLINQLECASATLCFTSDGFGNLYRYNGSTWSPETTDVPGELIRSVSCPTTTYCVLVTSSGKYSTWNGSSWTAAADSGLGDQYGISCATTTYCGSLAANGTVSIFDGVGWVGWTVPGEGGSSMIGVQCPVVGWCMGLTGTGQWTRKNGTSWTAAADTGAANSPNHLSCTSSTFCTAVAGGFTLESVTWDGSTWHDSAATSSAGVVVDLSCATHRWCMAVDSNGDAYTGTR